MDNRLIWGRVDNLTAAAIGGGHSDVRFVVALHRRYNKPFIRADATLAETSTGKFCKHAFLKRSKMNCLYAIRLRIKEFSAIFRNHARIAVNVVCNPSTVQYRR